MLPQLKRGGGSASRSPLLPGAVRDERDAEQVFMSLQQLLGQSRVGMEFVAHDQPRGLVAPGMAPALPRDALLQLLADVQQQQTAWLMRASRQRCCAALHRNSLMYCRR